ncbi:MAG TPA: GNAT family N-acetyltransferase [Symbiobacteriaceae bacterium]|jgi:hypothetical protein
MPLTKAQKGDEPQLLAHVTGEPFFNLFMISNLLQGLDENVEAWSDTAGGVLMRRNANWLVSPTPGFDFDEAARIVDGYPKEQVQGLSGRPDAVSPLAGRLRNHAGKLYQEQFAALDTPPAPVPHAGPPRPARPDDLPALTALYADAGDMSRTAEGVRQMLLTLWVVEADGVVVTAGNMSGETEQAGMIGAVFTPPVHRRKGYATTLVHAMSAALLERGKRPCLFYWNPDAGRIYLRLGYRPLGPWWVFKYRD